LRAVMTARTPGGRIITLTPERRFFPERGMWTTEAAIRTSLLADLYAVIGERQDDGAWVVRLYHNPLVPWIWLGAGVMFAGGLCSLADRRLRIGAPRRARTRTAGQEARA
jgi:cytochrome c-type biogenesis protein CcmF